MSDQNSDFPFGSLGQEEELDINAIFGGGTPASNVNPFASLAAQQVEAAAPPTQPQAAESTPSQLVPAPVEALEPIEEPAPKTPAAPQSASPVVLAESQPAPPAEVPDLIEAAFAKLEDAASHTAAKSLFE